MKKTIRIVVALVLAICMCACLFTGCSDEDAAFEKKVAKMVGKYTYKTYTTALGNNWNPHTWETNADDAVNGYITSPFCTMSIIDSKNGVYQWVWEMATDCVDVTKDHQDDLTKYKVDLPAGVTDASEVEKGYVFEIKLNPNAKWEDGTPINADSYIYSMKALLDSKMRNYRSNLYWSGESAVAGGLAFYNSEAPAYDCVAWLDGAQIIDDAEKGDYHYEFDLDKAIADGTLYMSTSSKNWELYSGYSLGDLYSDYGSLCSEEANNTEKEIAKNENAYGYVKITADNKDKYFNVIIDLLKNVFGMDEEEANIYIYEALFFWDGQTYGEKVDYDEAVGCYKVDDYTIRYVCQYQIDYNYFLTSLTSTWLVNENLYEKNKDTTGELVTTKYGTDLATTISYGPYKLESFQKDKQMVFVQNENWYGYTKDENGKLYSETNFLVDGEKRQQYQATSIIIDVMDDATAKLKFLKGELCDWAPTADDLVKYSTSDQLYKVDETYTMSLFFNTDLDALKNMDKSEGNVNSVVLSNINFRKAMSLAIDRAELVTATAGYKPAYSVMNNLYYYDVYNDPTSSYRSSDQAMQAICNVYNVEYGEGKTYATLKEAYESITGYNVTEAKELMKTACQELVEAGLYTEGAEIKIRLGWKASALESDDNKQVELLQKYMNAAIEGSGFGKITLEPVGSLEDRYGDVPAGKFAIGYGAWGGAAFYPFRNFQVYMDPDNTDLHEAACWDPTTEKWTLDVNGEAVEMTCQNWANALIGTGAYANADFDTKLSITAQLEEQWLKKYFRIPLSGSTACSMLSYQVQYYTNEYNIMYDFGGLRLMSFTKDDADWARYVRSQKNSLNYE